MAVTLCLGVTARADEPIALKILYAGNPGSSREKDFVAFLKPSFQAVETTDYRTFQEEQALGHDVVIFDWTSTYPRDKDGKVLENIDHMNNPKVPKLSEKYDRATILIGGPGQRVVKRLRLKIDWLCHCLDEAAHGMATAHDIFRTPLKVDPTLEEIPTPAHYPALASGKPIGKTIKVWKVQTKKYPEIDPGLVSDGYVFEDSPDAEFISSGLNQKGPESVALGRQGNFFLWGFSASPSDMTPEARRCFVNSICYIKRFDGQAPIVHEVENGFSRRRALMNAHFTRTILDPDAFKRMLPEFARADPERFEEQRKLELHVLEQVFPADVRKRAAGDPGAYVAWVEENFEWLRPGPDHDGILEIAIDSDVKSLGLSNHKVDLLDACVAMLERRDRPELAYRVLKRYTTEDFADSKGWRSWLVNHHDRLFFTEAGGYKFMVAPETVVSPMRPARTPLSAIRSPNRREPVVAETECSPTRVRAGDCLTLVVRVRTAPSWHITAVKGSKGPEVATSLSLTLPPSVEPDGDWSYPEPLPGANGHLSYAGTVEFRRRLRVNKRTEAGPIAVTCTLGYQACDPFSCRPPTEMVLEVKAEVVE